MFPGLQRQSSLLQSFLQMPVQSADVGRFKLHLYLRGGAKRVQVPLVRTCLERDKLHTVSGWLRPVWQRRLNNMRLFKHNSSLERRKMCGLLQRSGSNGKQQFRRGRLLRLSRR